MEKQFSLRKELPKLFPLGFKIFKCPEYIFDPILEYYQYRKKLDKDQKEYLLYDNPKFCQWVIDSFQPIFEKEAQLPLEFSHLYGIKCYKKGEKLLMSRTSIDTHHLSSQIIISQDKEWPFQIWDYNNKLHTLYINPGEFILYEGAKRSHARLIKYQGNSYDLIYLDYKFKNWEYIEKDLDK